ncbi:hypothetical protein ACH5RR_005004 [Cinchona calisaya]|uniref:Uncharacterized protein n=1 Tax=Cinchona calisaya TaxID=153742 RepID=A0ABD3AZ94_9GENT
MRKLLNIITFCESGWRRFLRVQRAELYARARQGETVVPGSASGKSLEAHEHLAEGRSREGQSWREQLGREGYQEMGRKCGPSTTDKSGGSVCVQQ